MRAREIYGPRSTWGIDMTGLPRLIKPICERCLWVTSMAKSRLRALALLKGNHVNSERQINGVKIIVKTNGFEDDHSLIYL